MGKEGYRIGCKYLPVGYGDAWFFCVLSFRFWKAGFEMGVFVADVVEVVKAIAVVEGDECFCVFEG